MNITKVQVHTINDPRQPKLRAKCDIIIDDEFIIRGLVIIEGYDEVHYVAMPNKRLADGSYKDVAHPISEDCRRYIENKVLDAYEDVLTALNQRTP